MKKSALMLSILVCTGAASAGENSYSYQGQARTYQVRPTQRHIPEPSSWTPPERVPQTPLQIVRREQPKRLGGGFSSPSFSNPSFSNPSFSNPSFSQPSYSNPSTSNPSTGNPSFSGPATSSPSYSNPGLSNPSFSAPTSSGR